MVGKPADDNSDEVGVASSNDPSKVRLRSPSDGEGDGYLVVLRAGLSLVPWFGPLFDKLATRFWPTNYERGAGILLKQLPDAIRYLDERVRLSQAEINRQTPAISVTGQNANGTYRRTNTGLQEVSATFESTAVWYPQTVAFPAAFSSPPQLALRSKDADLEIVDIKTTSFTFRASSRTGVSSFLVHYQASGTHLS